MRNGPGTNQCKGTWLENSKGFIPDSFDQVLLDAPCSALSLRARLISGEPWMLVWSKRRLCCRPCGKTLSWTNSPCPSSNSAIAAVNPMAKAFQEEESGRHYPRGLPPASAKQFWKAGDYEGGPGGNWDSYSGGIDHVRVYLKFLHSNATSYKWAIGELLDNALDEVSNGAAYVKIDMLKNKKDGN
ncbi:hypothetical protein NL676_001064 [Syzygium grande]|nr:hypothetical protein NL676_001064 [Syzygium grande]